MAVTVSISAAFSTESWATSCLVVASSSLIVAISTRCVAIICWYSATAVSIEERSVFMLSDCLLSRRMRAWLAARRFSASFSRSVISLTRASTIARWSASGCVPPSEPTTGDTPALRSFTLAISVLISFISRAFSATAWSNVSFSAESAVTWSNWACSASCCFFFSAGDMQALERQRSQGE